MLNKILVNNELIMPDMTEVAREILAYLSDHPDASDTREGIIAWWLMERRIKHQSLLVQETLAKLVEQGILFETQIDKSPPVYGLKNRLIIETT